MIRKIWLFVFMYATREILVNGEKTDAEKQYIACYGGRERYEKTFWRAISLISKHREQHLADVCSAACAYMKEASTGRRTRASNARKPEISSYELKMNAALRITDVGTIAVQILRCTPEIEDYFEITKGRSVNSVYFVTPSHPPAMQSGMPVRTGTLDTRFSGDVDLSRWFDMGKLMNEIIEEQDLAPGDY